MEVDYLDLEALQGIVNYAVREGGDNTEFYQRVQYDLRAFTVMLPLLKFAKRSSITIPMFLAMDLNSIVREFGDLPKELLE